MPANKSARQQAKRADLKALHGTDFDKAYAAAQVNAHQMTLAALKAYAAGGAVPQFKKFASGLVPVVTAHLNMTKGLKGWEDAPVAARYQPRRQIGDRRQYENEPVCRHWTIAAQRRFKP